jgi:hypothetical protein
LPSILRAWRCSRLRRFEDEGGFLGKETEVACGVHEERRAARGKHNARPIRHSAGQKAPSRRLLREYWAPGYSAPTIHSRRKSLACSAPI